MTKLFLDTEFTGLHQNTTLISLALVAETGEEFYAELTDYDTTQLNDWLKEYVLSKLFITNDQEFDKKQNGIYLKGDRVAIKASLQQWICQFEAVEIWADVLAYDWVLFCELFGGALHIPGNIFYAPFDLATLFRHKNIINPVSKYDNDIERAEYVNGIKANRHNALADARVDLACFKKLLNEK